MPQTKNPWSDKAPPPLPSFPPAVDPDSPESGRWFLVSLAGRASMRIRDRFIVGSGTSCDLSLIEWGIAPHHALLTVEGGDLFVAPLSDAPTLVDGKPLRSRVRLGPNSELSFGELEFAIEFEPGDSTPKWRAPREAADGMLPPLEPVTQPSAPPTAPAREKPSRTLVTPVSLGIAVPLALFALWFAGADQWPARLAEYAAPPVEAPVTQAAVPKDAPIALPNAASSARDEQETAESALQDQGGAELGPEEQLAARTATDDRIAAGDAEPPAATPTAALEQPAAEETPAPQPVIGTAPDVSTIAHASPTPVADDGADAAASESFASAAPSPQSVAEVAPPLPPSEDLGAVDAAPGSVPVAGATPQLTQSEQPVSAEPVSAQEPPVLASTAPDLSAPEPTATAAVTEHASPGPPLIFDVPEPPPLVNLAALESADTGVKPPWSDQPPLPLPAPDRGPPLIFAARPALPLVDVATLARADTRIRPPWSGEPTFAVPRRDHGVASIVNLTALTVPDRRVRPPWSDGPALVASSARADDGRALAALMAEADKRYSQGDLVTPPRQSAADLYVKVLEVAPKSRTARTRLNNIVGWVALDASDQLAARRVENARQTLARLSAAVPTAQRASVDPRAMRRWRVAEMLLNADGLMQKRRIVGPTTPNAVTTLRDVLKIDRHNATAQEMLARAMVMLAAVPKR